MAVSRRLRFEILRRDDHTCRYCGGKAPDVALTVDHVVPTALGGKDDPANLVTACQPCNAGKTSLSPDARIVADVSADALRWSSAMRWAVEERRMERELVEFIVSEVDETWRGWTMAAGDQRVEVPRALDWQDSLERFVELQLDSDEMVRLIGKTMRNQKVINTEKWTYFCGCCWKAISALQDAAKSLIDFAESQKAED